VDKEKQRINRWMLDQRKAKERGNLSEARINALNEIGFVWQGNTLGFQGETLPNVGRSRKRAPLAAQGGKFRARETSGRDVF